MSCPLVSVLESYTFGLLTWFGVVGLVQAVASCVLLADLKAILLKPTSDCEETLEMIAAIAGSKDNIDSRAHHASVFVRHLNECLFVIYILKHPLLTFVLVALCCVGMLGVAR